MEEKNLLLEGASYLDMELWRESKKMEDEYYAQRAEVKRLEYELQDAKTLLTELFYKLEGAERICSKSREIHTALCPK